MTGRSARNPAVQELRRLSHRRSARAEAGAFVIDGPVLIAEALAAGLAVQTVFVDEHVLGGGTHPVGLHATAAATAASTTVELARAAGVRVVELAPGVLASAVDTVSPQPIAAIARTRSRSLADVAAWSPGLVLVLAGISDPGNAGTLLRSAEAAGAAGVIAAGDTVDLHAPKTVRASAGAIFHVPVVTDVAAADAITALRAAGLRCAGTVARGGAPYDEVDLAHGRAIVLGNEAHGLDHELAAQLDELLTIPMAGRAESLNVAMAGTVLCFEYARQRRGGAD